MDTLYLDNLEEFIFDEGRVVTYRWLSLTLNVSVNLAKQMLYHFVEKEHEKKEKDSLSVTYLVTGLAEGNNGTLPAHKVIVVEEDRLEKVKASLKEVQCVHVYSVQKSKLKDLSVLYTSDYEKIRECRDDSKYSGVVNADVKLRSNSDVAALQKQHAYKPPTQSEPPQSKFAAKKKENTSPKKSSPRKSSPKKSEIRGSSNKASGALQSMFANQTKKAELKKENTSEEKMQKIEQVKKGPVGKNKSKGALASFLARGPPKASTSKEVKCTDIKQEIKEEIKEPKIDSEEEPLPVIKKEIKEEAMSPVREKKITKGVQKKSKSRGKTKRNADNEDPLPSIKRKRIMQMSDSESSSEEVEDIEDEESPLPCSPPPPVARIESESEDEIPPTPEQPSKTDGAKSRTKKWVEKTFMDDDGYIVTKKEYVMVSEDEDDERKEGNVVEANNSEEEKKENSDPKNAVNKMQEPPKKNNVSRKPSPVKTKQSNIMSFFKKKT